MYVHSVPETSTNTILKCLAQSKQTNVVVLPTPPRRGYRVGMRNLPESLDGLRRTKRCLSRLKPKFTSLQSEACLDSALYVYLKVGYACQRLLEIALRLGCPRTNSETSGLRCSSSYAISRYMLYLRPCLPASQRISCVAPLVLLGNPPFMLKDCLIHQAWNFP